MNLDEFKAFIEGIEHAFGGEAPNAAQWQLIKDKLHQVREKGATPPGKTLRDLDWEEAKRKAEEVHRKIAWPHEAPKPMYQPKDFTREFSQGIPDYDPAKEGADYTATSLVRDPYPAAFERESG